MARTAVKATKTTSTAAPAPGSWEDELARYAQQSAKVGDAVAGAGAWLTFKSGVLAFKGLPIKGNAIECVILDECLENLYYAGQYDPDAPASPICYALAREAAGMAPHATSPKPQHTTCAGCPQNAFGTSNTGKGKACKNTVRLALIAWGDGSEKQLASCEVAFAKLPVTSTRNWGRYTLSLRESLGLPPLGVVTRLSVRPDSKTQLQVEFERVSSVPAKFGATLLARRRDAVAALIPEVPYQQVDREEQPTNTKKNAKVPARRAKY